LLFTLNAFSPQGVTFDHASIFDMIVLDNGGGDNQDDDDEQRQ